VAANLLDLGAFFSNQISSVCRAYFCRIYDLRRIRSVLDFDTARTIAHLSFTSDLTKFTAIIPCTTAFDAKTQLNRLIQ